VDGFHPGNVVAAKLAGVEKFLADSEIFVPHGEKLVAKWFVHRDTHRLTVYVTARSARRR
jgi:hypothetical protein